MRGIATDERRHAELAWAVDSWARAASPGLAPARVSAARRRAVTRLAGEVLDLPRRAVAAAAGLPSTADALALFEMARQEIGPP